ncbi:MAG: choice-of-anchor B family protein [Kiloniellales bacterium]|nr:choice-of-anchor B family protein [Kiloniellales bacterium]
MNHFTTVVLAAAAAIAISTTANAHRPDDFDGGKTESFRLIAAKNKAKLLETQASSATRSLSTTALSGSAASSSAATADASTSSAGGFTFAACKRGLAAGQYPCKDVDLLAHIDIAELGVSFVNDIWGWTDPKTRREYALLGATEGTLAIDVTRPLRPKVVGFLPAAALDPNRELWRDIKVYKNHAFIGSEATNHGLQVLDLRTLRGLDGRDGPVILENAALYNEFSSSHNVAINVDSGFAYVVGANTCRGGLEMIDISDPSNPTNAGCFSEHGYVHDTQCVNYKGPDRRYRNHEICFSSSANRSSEGEAPFFNTLSIVDVTDKDDVKVISNTPYADGFGYSHQGWLTPDQAYFIHDDELDELFEAVSTTTTRLWDLHDLENPVLFAETTNGETSIDHNLYTRGKYSFASNYTSGLRIFDISRVADGRYDEVAFFDMYPEDNNATFDGGTWSNYPYFKRPNIIAVSSMDRGFFLLRPRLRFDFDDDDDDDGDGDDDD